MNENSEILEISEFCHQTTRPAWTGLNTPISPTRAQTDCQKFRARQGVNENSEILEISEFCCKRLPNWLELAQSQSEILFGTNKIRVNAVAAFGNPTNKP